VLISKFGKSANFVVNLPICQNYIEISLYGQDLRARQSKNWKMHQVIYPGVRYKDPPTETAS
jgi:hypothetical protein